MRTPTLVHFLEPHFLCLLNVDSDAVYLPLRKGDNELVLAVTEFSGGWGFICKAGSLAYDALPHWGVEVSPQ